MDGRRTVVEPEVQKEVFGSVEQELDKIAQHDGELRMIVPMLYQKAKKTPVADG